VDEMILAHEDGISPASLGLPGTFDATRKNPSGVAEYLL
jgi:hypothetical protein